MGDDPVSILKKKCKATVPRKTPCLFLSPVRRMIYKGNDTIVLKQFGLALTAVEKGKSVHGSIESIEIPTRCTDETYEEKYRQILGMGELLVGQCCTSCRDKFQALSRRTFEVDNRDEYLNEISILRKDILENNLHQDFRPIFPSKNMMLKFEESYQEVIEEIKDYAIENLSGDTFIFAMEYWDDNDEDYKIYIHSNNTGNDPEVELLIDLLG